MDESAPANRFPDDSLREEGSVTPVRRVRVRSTTSEPSEHQAALDAAAAAAEQTSLAQLVQEQFSLEKTFGGPRGVLEGVLPVTLFSVVYGINHNVRTAALAALAVAAVFALWRLIKRENLTQALSGVLGVGIGAFFANRTGQAENYFVPAMVKNAAFAVGYALSIAFRWPVVGLILGFAYGELFHWREVPARYRVYVMATWLWVGMFLVRLAVQLPLYFLGHERHVSWATSALGFSSVVLGLPLFIGVGYLTWRLVSRVPVAHPPQETPEETPAS